MTDLELRGVHQSYGPQEVLKGVDLAVEDGCFTAVLGPSGCGKTTLLRVVAGFQRIQSGMVRLGTETVDDGRRAVTHYRVAEVFGGAGIVGDVSLLHVRLDTGRTHQIRVHCAAIGHPVVGDRTYGAGRETLGMSRQALHAARLRFAHPITHEALSFSSPWPSDIAALDRRLREKRIP